MALDGNITLNNDLGLNRMPGAVEYIISAFFAVAALFAVVCNVIFCVIVCKKKSSTTKAAEYFFLNLSFADMMAGLLMIIIPGYVIPKGIYPFPRAGLELFCRLVMSNSLFFMLGFISVWTLLAISIDRWYAIARPLYYKEVCTKKRALMAICIIWIANIGLATDNALNLTANHSITRCKVTNYVEVHDQRTIVTLLQLIRIFIPALIFLIVYMDIGYRLLRSSPDQSNSIDHVHYCQRDIIIRRQVTIMSCIATIVFLICWLPNEIAYTVTLYDSSWRQNYYLRRITKLLMAFNSALNPFIYAMSNKYYRQGFLQLILCQPVKNKRRPSCTTFMSARNTHVVKLSD